MSPAGSVTGAMSGSGTVGNYSTGDVDFLGYYVVIGPSADFAQLKISVEGCTVVLYYYFEE
jgi:hypothetical protein